MKRRAFVFPGQGSQAVGMGSELAAAFAVARETFEQADDALKMRLSRLIAEGPIETLTLTENAQPALLVTSIAVLRVIEKEGGLDLTSHVAFVAGHSLGEYTALVAARSLDLDDAARLVRRRGQVMQEAVPSGTGAMAALLGCELEAAIDITREAERETGEVCAAANDNGGGQVVISGHKGAVDRAIQIASERGIKRAILLPVSAPFHSPLMQPAAAVMAEALAGVELRTPEIPLIANVTAGPVRDAGTIRDLLVQQVTGLVRWRESVQTMKAEGVEEVVEIGPGKVLAGLVRRIDKDLGTRSIQGPADIEAFFAAS